MGQSKVTLSSHNPLENAKIRLRRSSNGHSVHLSANSANRCISDSKIQNLE